MFSLMLISCLIIVDKLNAHQSVSVSELAAGPFRTVVYDRRLFDVSLLWLHSVCSQRCTNIYRRLKWSIGAFNTFPHKRAGPGAKPSATVSVFNTSSLRSARGWGGGVGGGWLMGHFIGN